MALPRVTVDGRLAADPELRFSQAGTAVCRLRLVAADRRKNEATNEWEDASTLWLDATAFGKMAENAVESLAKGDLVLAHGRLQTDEWVDRDSGQKRSKITMIIDAIGPSLQFRQTPHSGGQPRQQQQERFPNPVTQAYPQGDVPPF